MADEPRHNQKTQDDESEEDRSHPKHRKAEHHTPAHKTKKSSESDADSEHDARHSHHKSNKNGARHSEKDQKENEEEDPKKPPIYKRPVPMIIGGAVLLLIIVGGIIYWLYARQYESTDDAFIDGHVVTISPNVSATVLAVHVDDNSRMKKGDLLIELDPRDYQVVVDQMQASLAEAQQQIQAAQAQLEVAKANVAQSQAELVVAQTNADNAQRDYERFASLNERSRSQQELDNATASSKSAAAQVTQAKAKLAASQASVSDQDVSIKTAQAAEKHSEADLQQAQINLSYCKIFAPCDGMVTRKAVEPGDYVSKGDPLFSLVPTNVWVTANFKETQLALMRPGQNVTIEVDAYTSRKFHGKVDSIQNGTGSKFTLLPTENATGNYVKIVQRIPVKIVFDPGEINRPDFLLAPGMSVFPTVKVR